MARAVLDIGSNTIRLLVAEVRGGQVETILDDSDFVRLGRDVDKTGELQADRMDAALESIQRLVKEADERDATPVIAVATSAVRDARNGPDFVRRVRDDTGVEIEIISGGREADLTFRGATLGVPVSDGVLVTDLGGGSAELIYADGTGIRWRTSEQIGSGRLTERFVQSDPPRPAEIEAVEHHVIVILRGLEPAQPASVIFTGGTATHVALVKGSQATMTPLSLEELEQIVGTITSQTADDLVNKYRFRPERARVLAAGAATLDAIVRFYRPERILITRGGIREGALLDAAGDANG
jgi:exopolyphosphatase/guanosine-5'-triphosphate,3'-diphosphate pyrophosphatase